MLTDIQLEKHNTHITGSKVASILEIEGAYMSKYRLWLQMKGLIPPENLEGIRLKMGIYAEEMMRKYTRMELGWVYERRAKDDFIEHPKYPFLGGIVDGIAKQGKERFIVEMKNVDSLYRKDWIDVEGDFIVPDKFLCQTYFYMGLLDLPVRLIALFGGNDPVVMNIDRNPTVEKFIIDECCKFWNDLQEDRKPSIDGSESTEKALKMLFPDSKPEMIIGDNLSISQTQELIEAAKEYKRLGNEIKDLDTIKRKFKNLITERIGDNEGIKWSNGDKITYKKTKDGIKFDEKTFKTQNPELYQKYIIPKKGYRRINIKIGGEANGKQ